MSTLAEQVVEQLKTDMDNVYDAGYQKGVKETDGYEIGVTDGQSLFGIPNEVTGTNIATCDYVNENPHNVEVKLSSDTVTDFSGVEVKCIGKNIFDVEKAKNESNYLRDGGMFPFYFFPVYIGTGNTFTFSWKLPNGENLPDYTVTIFEDIGTKLLSYVWYRENAVHTKETVTLTSPNDYIYIRINKNELPSWWEDFNDIQIEISPVKTDYEPYTETLYTANADGTVDVTSISPTMNIICDTEGVNVSAKYYARQDVEWNRFWDIYQDYGTRNVYNSNLFRYGWNDSNFRPKYDMNVTECDTMFSFTKITDLNRILTEQGVTIDFSNAKTMYAVFNDSQYLTTVPPVVLNEKLTVLSHTFLNSQNLHTIPLLVMNDNVINFHNTFMHCYGLKNITISGEIKGGNLNFQWSSLLTVESVQNIIDCLADLTGQTTQTITFHADVKAKLTEEQIASITAKNWTLA